MLGRQVGSAMLRLPINARLPFRPSPFRSQNVVASRLLVISTQRFYATPGRPRKAVGEPSRPVKRNVKRAARSSSTGEAGRQVRAKKSGTSTKSATAKKSAAKKTTPKKRTRKPLTDEQKAVKQARITRAKITELKKQALSPPKDGGHVSAHTMLLTEKLRGASMSGPNSKGKLGQIAREAGQEYRQLTPSELEHYNHLAQQERQKRQAEHKRWVESFTPEEIQRANNARHQLKRKLDPKKKGASKFQPIKDERHVKRPVSAFIQFSINRQASGDFRNIRVAERAKLIGQEWRALNESEKKKYKDLQSEDIRRYSSEYTDVFGHSPPQVAAAAA